MQVSVVIPTYNRAKDLDACLSSISAQTILPKEIIIVDDSETDEIKNLINNYPANSQYFRLIYPYLDALGYSVNLILSIRDSEIRIAEIGKIVDYESKRISWLKDMIITYGLDRQIKEILVSKDPDSKRDLIRISILGKEEYQKDSH